MIRPMDGDPNPWLFKPRPGRHAELRGIQIHATRSGVSDGDDGPRTERWMKNPNNRGANGADWGGSCDSIIFEDGTEVIVNPDWRTMEPTYSAGFGDSGTWSGGWYYWQAEVAQGRTEDVYTDAQVAAIRHRAALLDIPLERIGFLIQKGVPPWGICTHEDSANGKKLGKSDPGPNFPWGKVLAPVEEEHMGLTIDQENMLKTTFQKANENETNILEVLKQLAALSKKLDAKTGAHGHGE